MTPEIRLEALTSTAPLRSLPDLHEELLRLQDCFKKGAATDEEKSQIFTFLNFHFEELKRCEPLMSLALYTYGRCIYGKDYTLAAITLRLSLEWQIEKGTQFLHYNSFADMKREPFDFEKIDQLLEKVRQPDMMLIHTLKWYAFACMNSNEVGNASQLERFEKLYGKIRTLCASLNTPDSVWEIGQIIYNSRPLCGWKKPNDWDSQLAWIKGAEYCLKIEGNTERARAFQAQLFSMESNLLSRMPQSDGLFNRQIELARRAYKTSQETPDFDPFLKLKFLNDLATLLNKAYMNKKEGISKEEILSLFKQLVPQVLEAKNPHEYHIIYLRNAADFELYHNNFVVGVKHLIRAAEIALQCNKKDDAISLLKRAGFIEQNEGNHLQAKALFERAQALYLNL